MIARPCLACGHPIAAGTHCTGCRPAAAPRTIAHAGTDPRWRQLSLKARKLQPWCLDCHTTTNLTADHILPVSEYPELAYAIENLTVRCRSCNSRRGTTYTPADAQHVLSALQAAHARRPKAKYRQLIAIAQRAADQGEHPAPDTPHPGAKARSPLHTPGGYL